MNTINSWSNDARDIDLIAILTPGRSVGAVSHSDGSPILRGAQSVRGYKVVNLRDETLGTIDNILLDMQLGRIAYAVMSTSGFLGIGERLFPIPWSALTLDADRNCFVMDSSKKRFERAPGFDRGQWPKRAGFDWHEAVHNFHGRLSYGE